MGMGEEANFANVNAVEDIEGKKIIYGGTGSLVRALGNWGN